MTHVKMLQPIKVARRKYPRRLCTGQHLMQCVSAVENTKTKKKHTHTQPTSAAAKLRKRADIAKLQYLNQAIPRSVASRVALGTGFLPDRNTKKKLATGFYISAEAEVSPKISPKTLPALYFHNIVIG